MADVGRPSEYKEEYIEKVDDYLAERIDYYDTETEKFKVQIPTLEGFALYIGVNKTSLYEWEKKHPLFSNALEKIRTEQQQRLLDNGLSGAYNPTIAKLVLSANHGMREKTDVTTDDKQITFNLVTDVSNKYATDRGATTDSAER